jgi:hypothetical protein
VVNALRHAGVDVRQIPATPERIMGASIIQEAQRTRRTRRTQRAQREKGASA